MLDLRQSSNRYHDSFKIEGPFEYEDWTPQGKSLALEAMQKTVQSAVNHARRDLNSKQIAAQEEIALSAIESEDARGMLGDLIPQLDALVPSKLKELT